MSIKVTLPSNYIQKVSVVQGSIDKQVSITHGSVVPLTRLDGLLDVDASDADTGETLVYDANTNTFIVQVLPLIDGGTF